MTDNEKAAAVLLGNFLGDREENGLRVQLYSIDTFYVEVFYDGTANKIVRLRAFKSTNLLTPYLAHIKFNLR